MNATDMDRQFAESENERNERLKKKRLAKAAKAAPAVDDMVASLSDYRPIRAWLHTTDARYPSGERRYLEVSHDTLAEMIFEIDWLRRRVDDAECQRALAYEMCAKIAEDHKGEAHRLAKEKGQYRNLPPDAFDEIRAEQRGEDIAAEIIARKIRERIEGEKE